MSKAGLVNRMVKNLKTTFYQRVSVRTHCGEEHQYLQLMMLALSAKTQVFRHEDSSTFCLSYIFFGEQLISHDDQEAIAFHKFNQRNVFLVA